MSDGISDSEEGVLGLKVGDNVFSDGISDSDEDGVCGFDSSSLEIPNDSSCFGGVLSLDTESSLEDDSSDDSDP